MGLAVVAVVEAIVRNKVALVLAVEALQLLALMAKQERQTQVVVALADM
jgi:hypothetical protein